eukprot:8983625-Alexandrium_andersonii.AAC.1
MRIAKKVRSRNGFEVWRLLCLEFEPNVASRSLALLQGLMAPQLAGDEATFEDRLLNWEDQIESYQEQTGK